MLEYGDANGAAAALRSLERTAEPLSSDANLAKANIEMSQGDVAKAQDMLSDIVTSNDEQSAEALIQFVDSHLEADEQIDEEVATLVESYAMEMRDDPIGVELRRAHVLALGKSGQFAEAFEALSRVRHRDLGIAQDSLRSLVLDLLARNADDVDFLTHAFAHMSVNLETIETKTRLRIAQRLLDLGFAGQAETVLAASPEPQRNSAARLLHARIALALSRPREVSAHLYGLKSHEAERLRALAQSQTGEFDAAHAIFETLEDEQNSARTAWLSNDWSNLVANAPTVFGSVAQIAQNPMDDDPVVDGMLSRATAAISESRSARRAIEDLLRSDTLGSTPAE